MSTYILLQDEYTGVKRLLLVPDKSSVEDSLTTLYPELRYKGGYLVKESVSHGYLYNKKVEKKMYCVSILQLDSILQQKDIVYSLGYAPNMVTNSLCGFGFNPSLL
jgi:hypothetical protein